MTKTCIGCGSPLQTTDKKAPGYINEKVLEKSLYCERCFKITHYGEATIIDKQQDVNLLIKEINKTKYPCIYLVDSLTLTKNHLALINSIKTKIYLVLTKKDLLPKSVKDKKLINYIKENYNIKENIFVVSSKKMYNINELINKLKKDNVKNIYVIGYTNSGKSSLINSFLKSVGKISNITTSIVPNTTTENINIDLNSNLKIIDTPGFINKNSIVNYIDIKEYKSLLPKKEIKPKIYTLKQGFMIEVSNILRIENNTNEKVDLIFYLNNDLKYTKMKVERNSNLKTLPKIEVTIDDSTDIVIEDVGFIKTPKQGKITIYTVNENIITKRNKMI